MKHFSGEINAKWSSGRVQKSFSYFNNKECKTFVGIRPRKMMLETRL